MDKKLAKSEEVKPLDGRMKVGQKEAAKLLKEHDYRVIDGSVDSFVSLRHINKIYPNGVQAVYDFNLDIDKHDFIVLVGPSGCGKSTTLRMVAGLEDISSGYLYIDKVLSNYIPSKNRQISMVFQSYALYPQMTVFDNIAFPLKARRYALPRIVKEALRKKEVTAILDDKIEKLARVYVESFDKDLNFGKPYEYLAKKLSISDHSAKFFYGQFVKKDDYESALEGFKTISKKLKKKLFKSTELEEKKLSLRHLSTDAYCNVIKDGKVVLKKRKLNKQEVREKVFEAARVLDLGPYLDRRPKELSGGQMQRVALGRAIVRNAKLFLMDEPLSNLDAKLRVAMRSEIVRIHERVGATTIYVTHDQTEAMTMANKIVVMSKGWIQQVGKPQEVYSHPNNLFVATFIGSPAMNIFKGTYERDSLIFDNGYSVKLGKNFKAVHDKFYESKILECENMIKLLDCSKENSAKALIKVANLKEKNYSPKAALKLAEDLNAVFVGFDKPNAALIFGAIEKFKKSAEKSNGFIDVKDDYVTMKNVIDDVVTLTLADVSKLYSSQSYDRGDKKKEQVVMSYGKRSLLADKFKHKKAKQGKRALDPIETKNTLERLLGEYKMALLGSHEVKIGIRPEHIHIDCEYANPKKTDSFEVVPNVVELLGSELLVHFERCNVDIIAKISSGTIVRPRESVQLTMNPEKLHVFDVNTGETIR